MQAPGQRHPPRGRHEWRQRQDRYAGPLARDKRRRRAGLAEAGDRFDVGRLGNLAGGDHDAVGDGFAAHDAAGLDHLQIGRILLDRQRHAVHRLDRLDRIAPCCGFRRQHDRIGTFVDRRRHVRNLGPRWHRRFDHRFKHLRRHDHRLGRRARTAHQTLLDRRNRGHRQFNPQIAAGDHDAVRHLQDRVIGLDRRRFLDLRQDQRPATRQCARFDHILGALHERQREPVDPQFADKLQIGAVLFRQGCQRQHHVGNVDAFAVGNCPPDLDRAVGEVLAAGVDRQADLAVVDQQRRSRLQRRKDLGVGQVDAADVPRRTRQVHPERSPLDQFLARRVGKGADPQLRSLQVCQNADRTSGVFLDLADDHVPRPDIVVRPVRHVQAEHVCPGLEQRSDGRVVAGGWAERGHDLHIPKASHALFLFVACRA